MNNTTEIKRTAETETQYTIRAEWLVNKFRIDLSIDDSFLIVTSEFGAWLLEQKPTLSQSTWRQYRASVLFYAKTSKILNHDELFEILHSDQEESAGGAIASRRQQRAKSLSQDELMKIEIYLKSKTRFHESHVMTFNFFIGTIKTALRPCEWKDAQLITIDGNSKLIVRNAKNTNGRSHGEFRTIHIPPSERKAMHCIESTLEYIKNIEGHGTDEKLFRKNYARRMMTMRKQFSEMNKFLFPHRKKKIHLYSGRHDAARRLKESGCTREEVAALMGHASILTAGEHYGRKGRGKGGVTPQVQPDKDDVARVGNLNANRVIKSHPAANNESHSNLDGLLENSFVKSAETRIVSEPSTNNDVSNDSTISFEGLREKLARIEAEMSEDDKPQNKGPKLF